jgi:hypothetical protein
MTDHAELIKWLRTIADNMSGEAYNADPWFPAQRADVRGLHQSADALSALVAERDRYKSALEEISKQVPAKDMDEDYYDAADFEDGYDRCIFVARAALASLKGGA